MENEVTEHLRALFVGVAPERTQEVEEFWARFGPLVQIVPDDDQGEAPVMEAVERNGTHRQHTQRYRQG